jgi:nucleoside-triphosphatase THEP1
VGLVKVSLSSGADLLIVNKFGKHEAEGRGFRDVIAEAVAMEIPVLVGLNALNRPAFESFAEGLAVQLPSDPAALMAWVKEVTTRVDEVA